MEVAAYPEHGHAVSHNHTLAQDGHSSRLRTTLTHPYVPRDCVLKGHTSGGCYLMRSALAPPLVPTTGYL